MGFALPQLGRRLKNRGFQCLLGFLAFRDVGVEADDRNGRTIRRTLQPHLIQHPAIGSVCVPKAILLFTVVLLEEVATF